MNVSTTRRLAKLYEDMNSREKADIAFARIASLDKAEVERIEATIPRKTYRMRDHEYDGRVERLGELSFLWGLHHWRALCGATAAFALVNQAWNAEKADLGKKAFQLLREAEGRLVALDAFLDELSETKGVDQRAVRTLAAVTEPFTPKTEPIPDPEFDAEMRAVLSKLAE